MERMFSLAGAAMRRDKSNDALVVEMAFASDKPYERWWGIEILDMTPASVRLGRLNDGDGGPVLFNHDWCDLRGRHEPGSVKTSDDGVLRGRVIVSPDTQVMRDTQAMLESKTLSKASVGYEIHRVIEQTTAKVGDKIEQIEREIDGGTFQRLVDKHCLTRDGRVIGGDVATFRRALDEATGRTLERASDDPPVYRVVDWEPLENSFVTVPADNSVGVGRSAERAAATSVTTTTSTTISQPAAPAAPTERKANMAEAQAAAGPNAETKISAVEAERERRQAILDLCKSNRIDARVESRWVEDGTPLAQVAKELLDVMEERGKAKPATASQLGLSGKETQRYSLFRAIRAMKFGAANSTFMQEAAFEIECSRAVAKQLGRELTSSILVPGEVLTRPVGAEAASRAMATQPGGKGGYMVNVENMGFIDILRNRSAALAMGARNLSGLQGNVTFARQTGKASVTWQGGEGTSITASDQALGQLSMTPKTAIAITDVSEQLLRQATPSAEAFVMADLAADIAIDGVDNAVFNGAGGSQPLGIKNTTGVSSGQDSAAATYAKVLAFVSTAGSSNAIRGRPGFVTNTAGAAVLMQRQRFTSTDTPLWTGNMLDGQCVGFNAMSSEQLASGNLIFGSWDEVIIGDWGVLELAMDNGGTRFNQAQVGIRAMWMVDVLIRYPQAFVVSTNLS